MDLLPTLTIVIPTRERADTLVWALKTCVEQNYERLQILISDNCSNDDTKEVVASYKDPRICYVNTGKRVGMSANWEFALEHVKGDYVSYIGDDDGFLPGAIEKIAEHLAGSDSLQALAWGRAVYHWPTHVSPFLRNTLFLHSDNQMLKLKASVNLHKLSRYMIPWASLPSIYNSFISVPLLQHIKQASGGHFFNSANPDVYSAIAIASHIDDYHFSMRPLAIAGISAKSTGNSFSFRSSAPDAAQRFLSENEISSHSQMVISPLATICATESMLQAQNCNILPSNVTIDLKLLISSALLEASEQPVPEYQNALNDIRQIGVKNNLEEFVEYEISKALHSPRVDKQPITGYDLRKKGLMIHTDPTKVKNVYDACLLCEQILNSSWKKYYLSSGTIALTLQSYLPFVQKRLKKFKKMLS